MTRTYIPGLKLAFLLVKRFVTRYAVKIKENAGAGLYAVIELVLDLAILVIGLIEGNSDEEGDFLYPMTTLTSSQINAVKATVAAFKASQGISEAW